MLEKTGILEPEFGKGTTVQSRKMRKVGRTSFGTKLSIATSCVPSAGTRSERIRQAEHRCRYGACP
jgi:DNA-binding GntR family transcriptional regulator